MMMMMTDKFIFNHRAITGFLTKSHESGKKNVKRLK